MSEAIHCDYCKKSVLLSDVTDWWRIEPVHAYDIGDDDGGDFCSARCAFNFFACRQDLPTGSGEDDGGKK